VEVATVSITMPRWLHGGLVAGGLAVGGFLMHLGANAYIRDVIADEAKYADAGTVKGVEAQLKEVIQRQAQAAETQQENVQRLQRLEQLVEESKGNYQRIEGYLRQILLDRPYKEGRGPKARQ
jgi:hypothetical protein